MNVLPQDDDRGQVGIGTLIIFIALVLVAAVAAGVLVNTAGLLQAQAEDTGSDAQSEVSNQIDVVSATGVVDTASSEVDSVELVVKKSPGSDPIDLSGATIQYTSSDASQTLDFAGDGSSANDSSFGTVDLKGTDSMVLDNNGDRIEITVDAEAIQGGNNGIAEGGSVTLRIVDQSGATTIYGVNVPDTLGSDNYVLV